MPRLLTIFAILCTLTTYASAKTYEVKMLSRGTTGAMVFEPDYLAIQPGDSVKFIATQKGHNAASIKTMLPQGATAFKGKIDEEPEVIFEQQGFYGIQCIPHYAMGMIMLIKVGNSEFPQSYRTIKQPGRAQKRFDTILHQIDNQK